MIGVIDCGIGNISSVTNLLDYIGEESFIITNKIDIEKAEKIIIPGVGTYKAAIENLNENDLIPSLKNFANQNKYILGICLGMQLLSSFGNEPERCSGINLIEGDVKLFQINKRIPHMGWNSINKINDHKILENVKLNADFYFVHSYYFETFNSSNIITTTKYGIEYPSIISNNNGNVIGIQFHPEKSQKQGVKIFENFLNL